MVVAYSNHYFPIQLPYASIVSRSGFVEGMRPKSDADPLLRKVALYKLSASPAIGAAVLAAKSAKCNIEVDFTKTCHLFLTIEM